MAGFSILNGPLEAIKAHLAVAFRIFHTDIKDSKVCLLHFTLGPRLSFGRTFLLFSLSCFLVNLKFIKKNFLQIFEFSKVFICNLMRSLMLSQLFFSLPETLGITGPALILKLHIVWDRHFAPLLWIRVSLESVMVSG